MVTRLLGGRGCPHRRRIPTFVTSLLGRYSPTHRTARSLPLTRCEVMADRPSAPSEDEEILLDMSEILPGALYLVGALSSPPVAVPRVTPNPLCATPFPPPMFRPRPLYPPFGLPLNSLPMHRASVRSCYLTKIDANCRAGLPPRGSQLQGP